MPQVIARCPCGSVPHPCEEKLRTHRPETNTALSFFCSNKDDPVHSWRKVLTASTSTTSRWKIRAELRDARRDKHEDDGFSRRHAPGAEGGAGGSGKRYGLKDIDDDLRERVHAKSITLCDDFGISPRAYRLFGELGGAARIAQSVLVPAESRHLRDCQATVIRFCSLFITQEEFGVYDVERLWTGLYDRSLVDDGRIGEADALRTWDTCVSVGKMLEGVTLRHVGETSQNVRWERDADDVRRLVGEAVPLPNQKAFLEEVHRMGVRFVAKQHGPEGKMIEFLVGQLFEGVLDIWDFFKILFRGTGRGEMTDFGCPTSAPCIVMLILGVGFPHRARGDADLEHRILQKIVPLLTCVLALDPRFAQRLADVCGQLPKAVLDAAAPEPLKTLRAAVSNPRGADLTVLRRIVGRIPDVAPASRTAPGGVARGAPPARRQGTPRPRTMPIQTTAQLRRGGYLAALVQPPPRILDPNWESNGRSLLREIRSSKGKLGTRYGPNLEDLRSTLERCGFSGPPTPWKDPYRRSIYAPERWPESGSMRSVLQLVRYLEGALANPEDSEATDTLASTAPAPAPDLSSVEWPRAAQLLLDKIRKERARGRSNLVDLRGTLTSYGFRGTQLLSNDTQRGVDAPVGWPRTSKMRRVTELVRYLQDALEKEQEPEEAGTLASTAPAPPRRAQPPVPPRRALSPPPQPRAEPPPASRFGYGANLELPAPSMQFAAPVLAPTLDRPFDVGCRIRLGGFLKKTHWNGKYGIIAATPQDVAADSRVYVDLGDDRTLSFRVERVEACPIFGEGAEVELCCPSGAQSEHNDRRGVVVGFETSGLLKVNLVDGGSVFARSVNLRSIPRNRPRRPINTSGTLASPSQAPTKKSNNDGAAVPTKYKPLSPYSPTEEGSGAIEQAGCDTASLLLGDAGGEEKRNGPSDDISLESGGAGGASPSLVDNRGATLNAALDEDGASESSVGDDRQLPGESARDHRKRMRKLKKEREKRGTYKATARYLCSSVLGGRSFETVLAAVEAAQGDANAAVNNLMGDDLGA